MCWPLDATVASIDEFEEKTVKIWPEMTMSKTRYHQIATSSIYR